MMKQSISVFTLILLAGWPQSGRSAESADPQVAAEPKEYILFNGADLKVLDGTERYPVMKVSDLAIDIRIGDRVESRLTETIEDLWIDREMKLNRSSAAIENLRHARTYIPTETETVEWGSIAGGSMANYQMTGDDILGLDIGKPLMVTSGENPIAVRGSPVVVDSAFRSGTGGEGQPERGAGRVPPNTFEVVFELSSTDGIEDPYLALVTDYRDPAEPNLLYRKFHLTSLRPVEAEPRKVILSQQGFPPGFQVEDFDVYVYSNGREIPTNRSEKQIALTRDEAFQYLVLEYIVARKTETADPRPLWVGLTPEVKELIGKQAANPLLRLGLDARGRVTGVEIEGGGPGAVDAAVLEAVHGFRFFPALDQGRAVAGTYTLRPKELIP